MTTIILTIIGILLAAAAALMVIFYGGDAFNGGSIGAQANTYQNAGTNVISAVQLAKADAFAYTGLTGDKSLVTPGTGIDSYLKELPTLPNGTTPALTTDGVYTVSVGGDQAAKVCERINKNLRFATPSAVTQATTIKMGCDTGTKVFFANA